MGLLRILFTLLAFVSLSYQDDSQILVTQGFFIVNEYQPNLCNFSMPTDILNGNDQAYQL